MIGTEYTSSERDLGRRRDLADVVGDELDGGVHKCEAGHDHDEVGHELDRRQGPHLQDVVDDLDGDVSVDAR